MAQVLQWKPKPCNSLEDIPSYGASAAKSEAPSRALYNVRLQENKSKVTNRFCTVSDLPRAAWGLCVPDEESVYSCSSPWEMVEKKLLLKSDKLPILRGPGSDHLTFSLALSWFSASVPWRVFNKYHSVIILSPRLQPGLLHQRVYMETGPSKNV
jgi:hypothetical protein